VVLPDNAILETFWQQVYSCRVNAVKISLCIQFTFSFTNSYITLFHFNKVLTDNGHTRQ